MKILSYKMGPTLRQYISVIFADFTFLQIGMHTAWLSPLLIQLKDENQKILPEIITDIQAAWLISISNLVGIAGLFFTGYLADNLGRRYTIILGYLPRLVNCLMFLIATDIQMMLLGRAIGGLSDVFTCSVTSAYASEIGSKEIRGGLGAIAQIMSALGSMIVLSAGPFLDYMTLTIVITCATVLTFIPLFFLPESPYLLYAKGKVKESTDVLTKLRNKDGIEEELKEYSLNLNANVKLDKLSLLNDRVVLKTFGKVIVVAIGSQTTGFNAVMFYLQTIFESTRTNLKPEISSVIVGCIQVFACCITLAFTDKFGRKPILTYSLVGLSIGMIGMGTFFKLRDQHYEIVGFLNYLPLISLMIVIFFFNAGIGATIWTLIAELFDGPLRAIGISSAVFVAISFTFLTTRYFASMTAVIGPTATYWLFGACCVITCLFIIFFIPETKGKAFSEIQKDMGRENMAFEETELKENRQIGAVNGQNKCDS